MYTKIKLSAVAILLMHSCIISSFVQAQEITQKNLKEDIKFLASEELAGRYPGTDGDKKAAEYIRSKFRSFGLKLQGIDGYQPFEVTVKIKAGKNNSFQTEDVKGTAMTDFTPAGFSARATLNASVIFAGYGLQAKNDTFNWDDFKEVDLKGKWCLMLRGTPEIPKASDLFKSGTQDRDKAMLAKDLGAAGVILVSGVEYDKYDELLSLSFKEGPIDIPVLHIKRFLADVILKGTHATITTLEQEYKKGSSHSSILLKQRVDGSADIEPLVAKTENVIGIIESKDPVLKNEFVVIGAHFDHLGMGGFGSGSRVPDTIAVHHGADDNASGVASVIELAHRFSFYKDSLKRSILFICFSAEEEGILGSKYFSEHPLIDLRQVEAMVNLDMVGRLREDRSLQIHGTGTSLEANRILNSLNRDSAFAFTFSPEGFGPSDHSSFYAKNIPVFFLTTGAHMDYHTPRDSYEGINFAGLKKVSEFAYNLVLDLDREPARLSFRESGPKTQETGRARLKVTLGIMPDFTSTENNGLRADFVTPGKPAFKAGMMKGDVIVSINDKTINNIQDYMYRMSKISQGETINVEVIRNGKKEVLIVQL
jgi:aminopeptidase YwaD